MTPQYRLSGIDGVADALRTGWAIDSQKNNQPSFWRLPGLPDWCTGFAQHPYVGIGIALDNQGHCPSLPSVRLRFHQIGGRPLLTISMRKERDQDMPLWLSLDLLSHALRDAAKPSPDAITARAALWSKVLNTNDSRTLGLAGELLVLRALEAEGQPAWHTWGERARHDIQRSDCSIEVKTTARRSGWRVHINGLTQPESTTTGTPVFFYLVRLEPVPEGGFSLRELAAGAPTDVESRILDSGGNLEARWNYIEARRLEATSCPAFLRGTDLTPESRTKLECISSLSYLLDLGGTELQPLALSSGIPR